MTDSSDCSVSDGLQNSNEKLQALFGQHREFTKIFLDAYVLVNMEGQIIELNKWFCSLVGMKSSKLKNSQRLLRELLSLTMAGSENDATQEILRATDPMRFDEVVCKVLEGDRCGEVLQLVIGTFPYCDDAGRMIGSCVMLRDVTAETHLQSKYDTKKTESITDALTGLFTRRYFEEWLDQETEFNKRLGVIPPLGLLMFDLDKFKSINDTHGHQAGDYVLAQTARIIKEVLRKSDIVGRYGGEEIIVILPGTSSQGTAIVAEKIRSLIATSEYIYNETKIPVTTSVGASAFLSLEENRKEVIARADACLYAAKRAGRNVVFCSFGNGELKYDDYIDQTGTKISVQQ